MLNNFLTLLTFFAAIKNKNCFNWIITPLQVTASAWINDLRNQIEQTRILSTVYRSATALGSRLPSIASAKARVAEAGAILRPVSSGTQVTPMRCRTNYYSATFNCVKF